MGKRNRPQFPTFHSIEPTETRDCSPGSLSIESQWDGSFGWGQRTEGMPDELQSRRSRVNAPMERERDG